MSHFNKLDQQVKAFVQYMLQLENIMEGFTTVEKINNR